MREGKSGQSQAAMQTFEASRPTVGSQAIGIARAAYEYALEYAKERRQFGKAIVENQAIAFTLADMKTEIDAARLLVWRAAWMGRNQIPFTNAEGSMSKVKAGEVAGLGHRARDPDPRWQRLHPRVPGRAHAPRREDLRHLRGHRRDPAPGDLAGDLRRAGQMMSDATGADAGTDGAGTVDPSQVDATSSPATWRRRPTSSSAS